MKILNKIPSASVYGIHTDSKSVLAQVTACCQIDNRPLPKPMITQVVFYACMHQ